MGGSWVEHNGGVLVRLTLLLSVLVDFFQDTRTANSGRAVVIASSAVVVGIGRQGLVWVNSSFLCVVFAAENWLQELLSFDGWPVRDRRPRVELFHYLLRIAFVGRSYQGVRLLLFTGKRHLAGQDSHSAVNDTQVLDRVGGPLVVGVVD